MDPKASAKAKRSHTQQGRKSHPTPASIAQKKKAAQVGSDEKVRRPHSQTLLPNWDRYDQREEEDESKGGKTLPGGEFAPKSKGADLAYLIEQARSQQPETNKASAAPEPLPFFDGITLDFMQAVSSLHTVRGNNLLSRCEDDNFVVDDDLTSSFEVPFLNLDLHALAAQLSKTKISERLFLEDDLFPEELLSAELKDGSSSLQSETQRVIDVGQSRDASYSLPRSSPAEEAIGKAEDHSMNVILQPDFSRTHPDEDDVQRQAAEAEESLSNMSKSSSMKAGKAEAETNLSGSIEDDLLNESPASKVSSHHSLPMNLRLNPPDTGLVNRELRMEAELDDLLDSSKETSSSGPTFRAQNPNFQSSAQDRVSLKSAPTALIDDSLDVLLAETLPVMKMQNHPAPKPDTSSRPPPSSFDPLSDVSASRVQKYVVSTNAADSSTGMSSKPGSVDVIDDFDSWMDTL